MAGSVLMLVAILHLVWVGSLELGAPTFDLVTLGGLEFTPGLERWLFLAFALAFAIKVPLFPFHTWLPDAHVEAPTAGSVILAGVLLKMGTYGLMRFCMPLFPGAAVALAPLMIWLGIIGIIYGALMALAQGDLKKLVAYSSVSHMGWIVLGLFALNVTGFEGGLLQMVNHGVNTGALFLLVGMIYDRAHTRAIADFGGVARTMPIFATMMMIFTLASVGLPGTNGFVGEFSILVAAFETRTLYAALAALGVVLGAVYMLSMYKRVFYGKASELALGLRDIGAREIASLVPLVALVFWLGVVPNGWLEPARPALRSLAERVQEARPEHSIEVELDARDEPEALAAGQAESDPDATATGEVH
jgi:NADH-quinone oxidoreductase subunit M